VPLYDPFDPSFQDDPYPTYQALRDGHPVYRHEKLDFWALSRFEDVWDAVRRPEVFSSASGLTFYPDEIGTLGLAPTMVMLDPPRHTQLRALVSRGFTARRVRELEDRIRAFVVDRITEMERKAADGEPVDLHQDLSSPLPTFVLAGLLGVPDTDRDRFDPWVRALVGIQDGGFTLDVITTAMEAVGEMFGYFGELITRRRSEHADDLISALIAAEIDGERLDDWDILGFCFVIVAGGNDTTGNLISHAVMLLDRDHRQRELLAGAPSLIPNSLMEFLRFEGSVQSLARTATEPVEIHGVQIPEGAKVMMMYGSANRDEREFGDTADRLDVTRSIRRHLGFATGPHFCVGSHLARLQARVALEELLARQPGIGVDTDRATRLASAFTRGWQTLPATGIVPAVRR
jgi:cytochrome P450